MKKLLPLLLIAALLCGCVEKETTPSLTTTTTASTTTTATATTNTTTTTPQATTTTAAENTPTNNLYIGKEFGDWYKDMWRSSYPVKGQEDPEERVIIDTLEENGYNIHLIGCNATREEDYSLVYYDGFMLVSEDGNTIAGTKLPFENKEYQVGFAPNEGIAFLKCYNMVKDGTVHKLYMVRVGVIAKSLETYFLVYDDSGFRYINEEPIITTGNIACYEDECRLLEADKNLYYIFDFENLTYRTEEIVGYVEYKPDFEPREKSEIDFLSDDQNEIFAKSLYIKSFGIRASNSGLSDFVTNETGLISYGSFTNVSYESFMAYICSVFTEEASEMAIDTDTFKNIDGRVCWLDSFRGADIDFRGSEYVLVSKDDNSVKFKCVAHYGADEVEYTEETELEMVKTEDGWRMKDYNLWY